MTLNRSKSFGLRFRTSSTSISVSSFFKLQVILGALGNALDVPLSSLSLSELVS
jgi:uncharacterized membrane protein